ncbi:unnamed protein product [Schistosoma guineensis]|nr:unnamed protein product [Schistosoma guineensis]CAH8461476.1 unnamed protein product [Schistosoma bovis]CAH8461857.1 unnamed protein product [Schistosoma bovis]CAH8463195.1 unnamed protein product [Schistosoma haematobium]
MDVPVRLLDIFPPDFIAYNIFMLKNQRIFMKMYFKVMTSYTGLLMGVFARVNSVAFSEDIPLNETAWAASGYAPLHVEEAYVMVSNNCFIAAGIYVVLLIFSGVQYYFNKRANYLAH